MTGRFNERTGRPLRHTWVRWRSPTTRISTKWHLLTRAHLVACGNNGSLVSEKDIEGISLEEPPLLRICSNCLDRLENKNL